MMVGGLPNLIRSSGFNIARGFWSSKSHMLESTCAFSATFPSGFHTQPTLVFPNGALISKRFFTHRNIHSDEKLSFSTKLIAGIGAALALGSGALYHTIVEKTSVFADYYKVACAGGDGDCIEKKCEDSPCLRKMDCEEELIRKANADLEKALKDVKSKAIEYTESAMKAYCEAIALMKEFLDQGYCAIDADHLESPKFEETWCCIFSIAQKRCPKVTDAIQKGQCAWELLCKLREVIEAGKACKYTSCNPLLVTAEESFLCAEKELLNLKAKMDCLDSTHDMVPAYKCVIQDFKKDLKSEMKSLPESLKCEVETIEQETAIMISLAYKRAVKAQKEMAQVLVCTGRVPDRLQPTLC